MELLFVLFLCGFAAATLIFWPLLNRANKRSAEGRSPQRGRHALDAASAPAAATTATTTAASTRTTGGTTASASTSENAAAGPEEGTEEETGGESTQPVSVNAPQQREPEEVEMPDLPTDLFETRYQAKFNRPKRRLERIKAEVGRME
ncbi:hypothetical protein GCM10009854_36600 [Saccharopolyspora halophila]|uniref:Uncharacterized protein n=1 Tax=Saccharopolyspora halophila TaxID=405551 RepID=A0ABP5TNZ8_9PSEU